MLNSGIKIYKLITFIIVLFAITCGKLSAYAFDLSLYTEQSLLGTDRLVVRVAVESEGLYLVPTAKLRSLGFANPQNVRVYGYGGQRIADLMTAETYVDDLPEVYSEYVDSKGLVFFSEGHDAWVNPQSNYWHLDLNPYTEKSYYFLCEGDDSTQRKSAETIGTAEETSRMATEFYSRLHHEKEQTSPGEIGPLLVGEDFRNTPSRTFTFDIVDPVLTSGGGYLECSMVTRIYNRGPQMKFTVNGQALTSNTSDAINSTSTSHYYHGTENIARHTFDVPDAKTLQIGVSLSSASSFYAANLNYLSVSYLRKLNLPKEGHLMFAVSGTGAKLSGATVDTRIWDVTDPMNIMILNAGIKDNTAIWSTPFGGMRSYVAWNPAASIPEPSEFKTMEAQNLHAPLDKYPELIIITPTIYKNSASRLASLHESDGMTVAIVTPEEIYNEFSSGAVDPSGIRKYLKMMYDRSVDANPDAPLRYVVLFTRPTYDHKHKTAYMAANDFPTIPSWMPRENRASLSDTEGYTTDDFIALLDDNSGARPGYDNLTIAVGRLPIINVEQAESTVDKIIEYRSKSRTGLWKNRFLFTADDEDSGIHLQQTEDLIRGVTSTEGNQHFIRKLYLDSYYKEGGNYPMAHSDLFRYLEEGVVWWNFIGHANTTSWTGDGLLNFSDMNNMYLKHWPFLYTATCDFLRWDSNITSGGEYIFLERHGGGIGAISAVRPVYISDNGMLSAAVGRALAQRNPDGSFLTPGEIYRRAKNDIRNSRGDKVENTNRLRYVFMGDPALPLTMPSNVIVVDLPSSDEDFVLGVNGVYELSGRITDFITGETLTDFNGSLLAELYDSERSVTTYGWGDGKEMIYDDYGAILASVGAKVVNGLFTLRIAMPEAIAQNYRPATLSLYAVSDGALRSEAVGLFRELYAFGEAPIQEPDTEAPVIDVLALNHSSFKNGDKVNSSPVLIAEIRDNVGINVATTGIGRQMTAIIDDKIIYSQIYLGYSPYEDGTPGGSVLYNLENLEEGAHTLTFRAWDTSGNLGEKTIDFFVDKDKAPVIFDVYTGTNPASTVANFYVSHDRPESNLKVYVTVYNLLGKPVWTGSAQGPSEMFESVPVSWNLCDSVGRRVARGIYVYRATIETNEGTFETASRRLAVTAR